MTKKNTFLTWKSQPDIVNALLMEQYDLRRAYERTSPFLLI